VNIDWFFRLVVVSGQPKSSAGGKATPYTLRDAPAKGNMPKCLDIPAY
jgi:hypothetical protein